MTNMRSDQRITYVSNSLLKINGISYHCYLENISTTGALLEINENIGDTIRIDDVCSLDVLLLSPVKYSCKVVHVSNNKVGLKFIDP